MNDPQTTELAGLVHTIESIATKSQKTLSAARWVLGLVIAGVLFIARTESTGLDHERRLTATEADTKDLRSNVSIIRGRLGLAQASTEPEKSLTHNEPNETQTTE